MKQDHSIHCCGYVPYITDGARGMKRKEGGVKLTASETLIITDGPTIVHGLLRPRIRNLNNPPMGLLPIAQIRPAARRRLGGPALGAPQHAPDLQEVALDGVDEALGLAVLAARADADPFVLDDVADAEAVTRRGAEAEVPQGGVTAVGCRQDGVIELVPAVVREDHGHVVVVVARGRGVTSSPLRLRVALGERRVSPWAADSRLWVTL